MSRLAWVALALTTALVVACSAPSHSGASGRHGCITHFDSRADYFPDKSTIADATNFTLSYHNSYQVLTVKQPYPNGRPESYVLVRCGAPAPRLTGDLARAPQLTVPVSSIYSASITQLGMIGELGKADAVTGVANTGNLINPETVLASRADVLVAAGAEDPGYRTLRDAGVAVVADAEWLEATPLGRAEWVKVLAALTGAEKKAGELYSKLRGDYHLVAQKASGARPVEVLPGTMYQGTWSMPAGGNYAGRLIRDAGGSYPWAGDTSSGSLQLNFESVYAKAGQAPLWVVANAWKTIDDALAADNRYGELAAVRGGHVWTQTADYWERGTARPDLLLGDLLAILHPELSPDHQFVFYRQVSRP